MFKKDLVSNFECFEDLELIQHSQQVIIVRIPVVSPFLDKILASNHFQVFFAHKFNIFQLLSYCAKSGKIPLFYIPSWNQKFCNMLHFFRSSFIFFFFLFLIYFLLFLLFRHFLMLSCKSFEPRRISSISFSNARSEL